VYLIHPHSCANYSENLDTRTKPGLQEFDRARERFGRRPGCGWYHSHTRTGVLLSDTDLTIHNRFFPDPWQVALVVKPHTFEPMRAGILLPRLRRHYSLQCKATANFPIENCGRCRQVPRAVSRGAAGAIARNRPRVPPVPSSMSTPSPKLLRRPPAPIVNVRAEPESPPPAPAPPIVNIRTERAATAAPQAHMPENRAGSSSPPPPPATHPSYVRAKPKSARGGG